MTRHFDYYVLNRELFSQSRQLNEQKPYSVIWHNHAPEDKCSSECVRAFFPPGENTP